MAGKKEEIMDCAESAIRAGGYSAFSFRTIADQLDIKSASVHYHFPTKNELVAAITKRYSCRFLEAIGSPDQTDALTHYAKAFVSAFAKDGSVCLCGVLASEGGLLDEATREALADFTRQNLSWLETALQKQGFSEKEAMSQACFIFSSLEGAMIFARVTGSPALLDEVANHVSSLKK